LLLRRFETIVLFGQLLYLVLKHREFLVLDLNDGEIFDLHTILKPLHLLHEGLHLSGLSLPESELLLQPLGVNPGLVDESLEVLRLRALHLHGLERLLVRLGLLFELAQTFLQLGVLRGQHFRALSLLLTTQFVLLLVLKDFLHL